MIRRRLAAALLATPLVAVTVVLALDACESTSRPVSLAASVPASSMVLGDTFGAMAPDGAATGQEGLKVWSTASATASVTTPAIVRIEVRARGDQCQGPPVMLLRVDGEIVGRSKVSNSAYESFSYPHHLAAGKHQIAVDFTNDHGNAKCDRNLWLDWVHFDAVATAGGIGNPLVDSPVAARPSALASSDGDPFAGAKLFVDPDSAAALSVAAARADPTASALLEKIAGQPQADWFSAGDVNPAASVDTRVTQISGTGALPVLVAYAIPLRDCGTGYSRGGVADSAAYHQWISEFAAGIGRRRVVVLLEPDALAQLDCLTRPQQAARIAMLKDAIKILAASPGTSVYLDAGNRTWHDPSVMAARLEQVGVDSIRGFSLNVSGFDDTTSEEIYGELIAAATGKQYIVDVSRNGRGSAGLTGTGSSTCNPAGRGLGQRPSAIASAPHEDALLWVKRPGESDGACGAGDPPAGVWSDALAEDLASRADW